MSEEELPPDDETPSAEIVPLDEARIKGLGGFARTTSPELRQEWRANRFKRDMDTQERKRTVLLLRAGGASMEEIAQTVGINRNTASKWLKEAYVHHGPSPENVDEARALELMRLDQMMIPILKEARKGNLGAVDRVLKIMERRARYIPGLEVPAAGGGPHAVGVQVEGADETVVKVVWAQDWRVQG